MGGASFSQSMFTDLCERMLRLCKLEVGESLVLLSQGEERVEYVDAFMTARPAARCQGDESPPAVLLIGHLRRGRCLDGRQDAVVRQSARGRHSQGRRHGRRDAVHALQRRVDRDPAGGDADPHLHRARRPARASVPDRGAQTANGRRRRGALSSEHPALHRTVRAPMSRIGSAIRSRPSTATSTGPDSGITGPRGAWS